MKEGKERGGKNGEIGDLLKSALCPAAQLSPKCVSHNILRSTTKSERMWLTDSAQRVGKAPRAAAFQKPKGVPTIDSLFQGTDGEGAAASKNSCVDRGGQGYTVRPTLCFTTPRDEEVQCLPPKLRLILNQTLSLSKLTLPYQAGGKRESCWTAKTHTHTRRSLRPSSPLLHNSLRDTVSQAFLSIHIYLQL